MATSPTFNTSNQFVKYNITVNINGQSISNNTSNITVTVRFWRTNSYETYGSGTVYCGINGTSYSQPVTPSQRITSSGIDLFSRTVDIPHNTDGTKTIWCSASISHNAPLSSDDQGFNVNLPKINRKSTISSIGDFSVEGEHWLQFQSYGNYWQNLWITGRKHGVGNYETLGAFGWYTSGKSIKFEPQIVTYLYKIALPETNVGTYTDVMYHLETWTSQGGTYLGEDTRVVKGNINGTMFTKLSAPWGKCVAFIRVDNSWKPCVSYTNLNGIWKLSSTI